MKYSIHAKLFFAILFTTFIVVVGMLLFTRWSIQTGFLAYVEDRQAAKITRVSNHLLDIYDLRYGWQGLANDKRHWLRVLFGYEEQGQHDQEQIASNRQRALLRPPFMHLLVETSTRWPSDRIIEHLQRNELRLPFETRMMLFDQDKQAVYGREDQLANSQLFPLQLDNELVGYLALIHGPSLTETGQIRFLEKQHNGLIWIALGILLLSALISLLLSRRLVKPVQAFRTATRQLATGNFDSRVRIKHQDELGELAKDINALGASLQANETARRQWVADIAHELRTPLSVLRSELEALQAGVRPLTNKAVDSLHDDTLSLGRLVDDLYQLSMTDLGALSYRKEKTAIAELLQDDINSLQTRFTTANIEIKLDINSIKSLDINADNQRLSQLFRNLLKNTLRYTDHGGQLNISGHIENAELILDFQDSAPGVPESELEKLFDRLYRVDGSRNRNTGGSGLGLAISRNIILAHDGKISALPSPLGGLWIQVKLPL